VVWTDMDGALGAEPPAHATSRTAKPEATTNPNSMRDM